MAKWLSVPDYLFFRLTGEQVTDRTIASRTLLLDQQRLDWSPALLNLVGLDPGQLPPVRPSGTPAGQVSAAAAAETGLPVGTACVLGGHDHLCAALAVGADHPGAAVDSSGTAQSVLFALRGFQSGPGLSEAGYACYAHVIPGLHVLKGGLKAAGGAVEWLARRLAAPDLPLDAVYQDLAEAARAGIGRRAGPVWLPHLAGSGTPDGDRHSRAALVGVAIEHDRGDFFRGMLEGLAFWLRRNLDEMEVLAGQETGPVILTGGLAQLSILNQLKADILGRPVTVPALTEAAATGAALLAGVGCGAFAGFADALGSLKSGGAVFVPDPERVRWYAAMYEQVYRPLYQNLLPVNQALQRLRSESQSSPAE